ncbi:hypothetical protein A2V49_02400 [candidate division WWE3 bacterium RBG_19FT_COMBO_34_6]|uniref:Uncharacterized protein n=1 Tax=candidate division WWE3 bacterium RBG_19FT_COMBO_34_6 TaxID=1802612 RepID=A0A1F4UN31_UNCKA|nr:MAG: hypothetical protein A2V49_02400 [candidate division WWE3 bacterium RBG_19FT_COMBO_34_6]
MKINQSVVKKSEKETALIFEYKKDIIRTVIPNNLLPTGSEEKEFRLIYIWGYSDSFVITIKSSKIIHVRDAYGDDYRLPGWKMKMVDHQKTKQCPE